MLQLRICLNLQFVRINVASLEQFSLLKDVFIHILYALTFLFDSFSTKKEKKKTFLFETHETNPKMSKRSKGSTSFLGVKKAME